MRRSLRLVLQGVSVSVVALLLVLLGWEVSSSQDRQALADQVASGERPQAPEFSLPSLVGEGEIALRDFRGKAVVLNFWASWCVPCKDEAPLLQRAWQRYQGRGVVVLGVDAQDLSGDARRFIRRYGLTYPNVRDGAGSTLGRYGITGFPETWFVDRRGRLVGFRVEGPLDTQTLERGIELALASSGS